MDGKHIKTQNSLYVKWSHKRATQVVVATFLVVEGDLLNGRKSFCGQIAAGVKSTIIVPPTPFFSLLCPQCHNIASFYFPTHYIIKSRLNDAFTFVHTRCASLLCSFTNTFAVYVLFSHPCWLEN